MNYIECPNCGNHLTVDSKFCNRCGTRIEAPASDRYCTACGNQMPADSAFCPHCGHKVGGTSVPEDNTPVISSRHSAAATDTIRQEELSRTVAKPQPRYEPKPQPKYETEPPRSKAVVPDDDDFEDSPLRAGQGSQPDTTYRTRNIIIAAVLLAFIGLLVVRNCFFSGTTRDRGQVTDSTQVDINSNNQSADIFLKTLQDNNLMGDRATVAYAMRLKGDNDAQDRIIGVSYLSNDTHPFYKIYELTPNGEAWNIDLKETKYLDGRNITFERSRLKADEGYVPGVVEVSGKKYFFFAYLSTPTTTSSQGQVVANLYDPEDHKVASTITYEGSFTNKDGEQVIYLDPRSNGSSMQNALEDHVKQYVRLVRIKSQEEIDEEKKEEEEEKKEDEEKKTEEEQWSEDNAGKMSEAIDGKEVQFDKKEQDKDKPMFRASDIQKKIQGPNYTIFLTKDGKVYSFNKTNQKNSLLYAGASKAQDIGWENSAGGILNIRTANGRLQYNVNSGSAVIKKEEPKKEEPKKPAEESKKE